MNVECSVNIYLKSGRILSSDPQETDWDTAQENIRQITAVLQSTKMYQLVRNGRIVLVYPDAIDYVEFVTDEVDDSADA